MTRQAWSNGLRALPTPEQPDESVAQLSGVVAVGSGKGGVGKTVVASNLALLLAESSSRSVVAVDADLGGANLHAGLGIPRPRFALNQFLLDGASLRDLTAPTGRDGLELIGGASDIIAFAQITDVKCRQFLSELRLFEGRTTLLDLGAGSSLFNLDLFSLAGHGVLVTTPEPTAIQNAYGFLRAAVYRRLRLLLDGEDGLVEMMERAMNHRGPDESGSVPDLIRAVSRFNCPAASRLQESVDQASVGLVVNMCEPKEGQGVGERLAQVARRYLGIRLGLLGHVSCDESVRRAIFEWRPLVVYFPRARATRDLRTIASRLLDRLDANRVSPEDGAS